MRIPSIVIAVAVLVTTGVASAQPGPPRRGYYYQQEPGIHRYGLVFGGSIGPGAFNFSDCSGCDSLGALAGQLEIGGMVAPNVALLFDWTGLFHPFGDGSVLSTHLFSGAIRFFFARILWLEGGIGIGWMNQEDEFGYNWSSGAGLGGFGAFGVELLQTYNFALDLSVRLSGERISTDPTVNVGNAMLLVGIHWY